MNTDPVKNVTNLQKIEMLSYSFLSKKKSTLTLTSFNLTEFQVDICHFFVTKKFWPNSFFESINPLQQKYSIEIKLGNIITVRITKMI